MRFLVDMGVSIVVVEWLRRLGHDVKHLREESLQKLPNGEIFSKAVAENRIILTFDLDFGEIVSMAKGKRVGVVLFRLYNTRASNVAERLGVLLKDNEAGLRMNSVYTVEDSRYRVREFPVGLSSQ